ncbi:hypothetical protein [Priestia megaterium]|uniref:hypothetical protein n=1 Tax=Priestia megaterium TaxID=1404 RepID=UPI0015F777E3|nr:hypothetical protein [Priestia megaterium]MEB4859780.1 hypothetical protein [Priestia megaterium]
MNKISNGSKLNEKTKEVISVLEREPYIDSIVLVGSINLSKDFNDYDLLILHQDKDIFETIMRLFSEYEVISCDDSIRIVFENDKDINLALYTFTEFSNKVQNVYKHTQPIGEHREWAIGYWVPEVLIQDIITCTILHDPAFKFKEIIEFVKENEQDYKSMIMKKCIQEIDTKLSYLEKNEDYIEITIIRNDLFLTFIRLYSIKNFKYLSGFKRFKNKLDECEDDKLYPLLVKYSQIINKKELIKQTKNIVNYILN